MDRTKRENILKLLLVLTAVMALSMCLLLSVAERYFTGQVLNEITRLSPADIVSAEYNGQSIPQTEYQHLITALGTLTFARADRSALYSAQHNLIIMTHNRTYRFKVSITDRYNYALVDLADTWIESFVVKDASSTELKVFLETALR
jgi:hypothetical protein